MRMTRNNWGALPVPGFLSKSETGVHSLSPSTKKRRSDFAAEMGPEIDAELLCPLACQDYLVFYKPEMEWGLAPELPSMDLSW